MTEPRPSTSPSSRAPRAPLPPSTGAQGFRDISKDHPNWKITHSQDGDFTSSQGKQVMEAFLKADPKIQVLYAHNDQMALGAIQAIKEAGLKPGKDIIIIGVDGVKGVFQAIVAGEANATIECNPLLGPQAVQAIHDLRDGKKLPGQDLDDRRSVRRDERRGGAADPPVLIPS